jgi:hypothetical protein
LSSGKTEESSRLFSVPVQAASGVSFGNPQLLFEGDYFPFSSKAFDVSLDGKRFLMIKPAPQHYAPLSPSSIRRSPELVP